MEFIEQVEVPVVDLGHIMLRNLHGLRVQILSGGAVGGIIAVHQLKDHTLLAGQRGVGDLDLGIAALNQEHRLIGLKLGILDGDGAALVGVGHGAETPGIDSAVFILRRSGLIALDQGIVRSTDRGVFKPVQAGPDGESSIAAGSEHTDLGILRGQMNAEVLPAVHLAGIVRRQNAPAPAADLAVLIEYSGFPEGIGGTAVAPQTQLPGYVEHAFFHLGSGVVFVFRGTEASDLGIPDDHIRILRHDYAVPDDAPVPDVQTLRGHFGVTADGQRHTLAVEIASAVAVHGDGDVFQLILAVFQIDAAELVALGDHGHAADRSVPAGAALDRRQDRAVLCELSVLAANRRGEIRSHDLRAEAAGSAEAVRDGKPDIPGIGPRKNVSLYAIHGKGHVFILRGRNRSGSSDHQTLRLNGLFQHRRLTYNVLAHFYHLITTLLRGQ